MESLHCVDDDGCDYIAELVESPILCKIGNADGENFHSSKVICKASVVIAMKEPL